MRPDKRRARLKLISCDVFCREIEAVLRRSPHSIDVEFLPKGLHDRGGMAMREEIQNRVDGTENDVYDAILLGYGLCNNGLAGIRAANAPLVLPRAHDCITLFLGSRQRYTDYFSANPGVYFQTTGWIERGDENGLMSQLSLRRAAGLDCEYDDIVQKYGEDNAKYLWDVLCDATRHYRQITFIEMGVEPDETHELQAMRLALDRGWCFKIEPGDISMLQRLVDGDWTDEEFLVVPPGETIGATHDQSIVRLISPPGIHPGHAAGRRNSGAPAGFGGTE